MVKKVLVVDDERVLAETIGYNLRREGYAAVAAYDGEEALQAARREKPDAIVLDVMLPRLDGFEVCRVLRRETAVPILMLTAREGEIDKVLGLELGADDYVAKPFSPRELIARVRAVLRRAHGGITVDASPMVLRAGALEVDVRAHEARRDGERMALTAKEFDLLVQLMRHPNRAFRREELLEAVWGYSYGDTATVTVHMRRLREKVESQPSLPRHLETVHGVGYRFCP
jgi:DNA-binding response OmpR family regulator